MKSKPAKLLLSIAFIEERLVQKLEVLSKKNPGSSIEPGF